MDTFTAEKVSYLLERKSEFIKDLSVLTIPSNEFIVSYYDSRYVAFAPLPRLSRISSELMDDMRKLLIEGIKENIKWIDEKILKLESQC